MLNQQNKQNYNHILNSTLNQQQETIKPAQGTVRQVVRDSFDDDEGTILKTVQHFAPNRIEDKHVSFPVEDRPIRPLKTRIENAFDDQGIPYDPELTNEYYQNDFEVDDSSPERKSRFNSLSRTVVYQRKATTAGPVRKSINQKNSSSVKNSVSISKTYGGNQNKNKFGYTELISYMQNALLDDKNTANVTFGDDLRTSVFGTNAKNTKIQNLKM